MIPWLALRTVLNYIAVAPPAFPRNPSNASYGRPQLQRAQRRQHRPLRTPIGVHGIGKQT